jgi:hypothetical protein
LAASEVRIEDNADAEGRRPAELAQVLLAYCDGLDCLAAGIQVRFASAASRSHEPKVFPPCRVDFPGMSDALPADDPLLSAVGTVMGER